MTQDDAHDRLFRSAECLVALQVPGKGHLHRKCGRPVATEPIPGSGEPFRPACGCPCHAMPFIGHGVWGFWSDAREGLTETP